MIVVVGDTSPELAEWCAQHFGHSVLIDLNNCHAVSLNGVYHTALGDVDFDTLKAVCLAASRVVYCDQVPWQDLAAKRKTQQLLNHVRHFRTVENFDPPAQQCYQNGFLTAQSPGATVWAFGCSHTLGVGLHQPEHQRFATLVAQQLNLDVAVIAESGTSTRWSLNHILQTKFAPNDIVIWATTSAERLRRSNQYETVDHMLCESDAAALDYYNDHQLLYEHLEFIHIGTTYLKQSNTKFVLLTLLGNTPLLDSIELECSGYQEWCPTPDWRQFDRGTDGEHIGPIGHQQLAQRIVDHVKLLDYV
jgi:hypothetical protein